MATIGVKRPRDEVNQEEFTEQKKFAAAHPVLSLFALPELVENIIKYITKYPRAILNIASVSKMHNNLVRSKALWVRLGYSPRICEDEELPEEILKAMLGQIRTTHNYKKLARIFSDMSVIKDNYLSEDRLELSYGNFTREEKYEFLANNYLSDEAVRALLIVTSRECKFFFSLTDLVTWLEQDPRIPSTPVNGTRVVPNTDSLRPIRVYFNLTDGHKPHTTSILFKAETKRKSIDYGAIDTVVLRRVLTDPSKTLLFISYSETDSRYGSSFVKYNRATKVIECCGDLSYYAALKFKGDWNKTLNYLCEIESSEDWACAYLEKYKIFYQSYFPPDDEDAEESVFFLAENVPFLRH